MSCSELYFARCCALKRTGTFASESKVTCLKCYCDENFVFSFPVFLSLISYLEPKFLESAKFSRAIPLNKHQRTKKSRPPIARPTSLKSPRNHYSGFLCDVIVTTCDIAKEMRRSKIGEKTHVFALEFAFSSFR